ncbi:ADP-ribosylglycohydrolase family protein [Nonomuraea sp. NPDC000554]|uniref:ADP-ribosylglycohydrolase family protein n=1 Tax=Nonomuraea sp. NPDC000554 TaxID=3154259 RepID=UPI003333F803
MNGADRVRGCLLGGAIGDALGAPVEFASLRDIRRIHGREGVAGYVHDWRGRTGLITDDTQMTLFTVEALTRALRLSASTVTSSRDLPAAGGSASGGNASDAAGIGGVGSGVGSGDVVVAVREAYLRWLDTQDHPTPPPSDRSHRTGRLREEGWLYSRRAPGNACLSGLHQPFPGPSPLGEPGPVNPSSKGCGTVMRSAPFGLLTARPPGGRPAAQDPRDAFELAAACAQITHGHPTGYLAAGAFAAIVAHLMAGRPLADSVSHTLDLLSHHPRHEETSGALRAAVTLAGGGERTPETVESLGGAWVAEEALAIGVYCALAEPSVERALLLSVNHSGDSDSTGSVCGNLLGALHGASALPASWLRPLEGRDTIERLADDLCQAAGWDTL